MINIPMKIHH